MSATQGLTPQKTRTRTKPGLQGADYTDILKKVLAGERTTVMDSAPYFVDAFKKWRRQSVDIEVEFESEDASAENPENPITLISVRDNFIPDKAFFFTYRADFQKRKGNYKYYEEHTKKTYELVVFWFPTEAEMLAQFCYFVKKTRPDMLYGWYFEDFDVPYILNRAKLLEVNEVYLLSPDGTVYSQKNVVKAANEKDFNRHGFRNVISGVTLFDMKWGYTRIQGLFPEGNGLNQVAIRHVGYGKKSSSIIEESWYNDKVPSKFDADKGYEVDDFKEDGFFKFIIYGFYDVLLPELIEDKCYVIFTFFFITRFTSIEWEKLHHFSVAIDMAQLMYKDPTLFLPSKKYGGEIEDYEIEGGAVENPPIGLIPGYMIVLDASRQYPNMIRDANLGVDTYIEPVDHEKWKDKDVVKLSNGDWFRKDVISFLSNIVTKIFALRDFVDGELEQYDPTDPMYAIWGNIKTVVKNLINAIYGANGNPHTRMFHLPTARSITLLGRELLEHDKKYTMILAKKLANGIVYNNKFGKGNVPVPEGSVLKSTLKKRYGDSVTGDRCVAIKLNGRIDVVPFDELWQQADGKTVHRAGKEIKLPSDLFTINKDGQWERVKEVIRHKTSKMIYRVSQKNGETKCTEDHSVITEGYVETKPLDIGDKRIMYLPTLSLPDGNSPEMVDLYEILKGFSYTVKYNGQNREYSWHKAQPSTVDGSKSPETIFFGRKGLKSTVSIKRYVRMDTLCKLLGFYVAEGHVSVTQYPFRCCAGLSGAKKDLIDEIRGYADEINQDAKISTIITEDGFRTVQSYHYYSKCYRIQMNNLTWAAFFQALCGKGSAKKKVPSFIFNAGKEHQRMFYDYYFLGDGSLQKNNGKWVIRTFTSKSLQLVSGLCFVLKGFGIDVCIRRDERKGTYAVFERKVGERRGARTVNKVVPLGKEQRYVYDLSLSDSHVFADACGMVLLHNTDSIFSHTMEQDIHKVVGIGYYYNYFMNKSLEVFCKDRNMLAKYVKLEFEAVYMNMFFPAKFGEERGTKKQYCLYMAWKDGKYIDPPKFKIMGMAGKKSNTPLFAKNIQVNFLQNACKGATSEDLAKYVVKIVKECKGYLKKTCCFKCGSPTIEKDDAGKAEGKPYTCKKCGTRLSPYDIVYDVKMLMKIGTPYRLGKQADQYNSTQIGYKVVESIRKHFKKKCRKAETYLYFWTSGSKSGKTTLFAMNPESPKVPRGISIDEKLTVEKIIHDKLKNILPLFHIEWDEVKSADTTMSLSKYAKV